MKTLTVNVPEDVFDRAERRAVELGTSLQQECLDLVERLGSQEKNGQQDAARCQMEQLFRTVRGFRMGAKIPREELYERGRVH